MATPAQLAANRENSKRSTGPRTEEGKARSALNNLQDGFRSQSVLLPADDRADYDALRAELESHFATRDLTELRCVREMADAEWRLRRARRRLEEGYCKEFENVRTQFPDLDDASADLKTFENLHQPGASYPRLMTYEAKFERQFDRAYRTWVQYNKDKTRARSQELRDHVNAVLGAPMPEIKLPNRTDEANSTPAATENRTFEPNSAPATIQNRTVERNSAPVTTQNGTDEPNSKPPATPRNAPCPCGSRQKFKRCCGRDAPPVLFPAVRAA